MTNNRTITQEQALDWLAGVFNEPRANLTPETPRDAIASWDSLGVLTLMAEMDEKFDLVLSDEEMRALTTVGDVLDLLRARGKLNP
jgi:acyl carrier protein